MNDFTRGLLCFLFSVTVVGSGMAAIKHWTKDMVPGVRSDEPYRWEEVWLPPVQSVSRCKYWASKSHMTAQCSVNHEGLKPRVYNMQNWAEGVIQPGDILGYSFKVNDRTVEIWNTRQGNGDMKYNGACLTKDPKCFWPSKNKCTKWITEKGVKLCEEYPPVTAVELGFGKKILTDPVTP